MGVQVFGRFLRERARGLAGWSLAVAAVTAMYAAFWPTMADTADLMQQYMEAMPAMGEAMGWNDMTSPEGYIEATVLLLVPVLMVVAAIGVGARAVAGDEEEGALELVMAYPVGRTSLLVQRFAASAVHTAVLGAVMFLVLLGLSPVLDLGIGAGHLAAACLSTALVALCYGTAAFAIGAVTGRRSFAIAGGAFLAVVGYLGDTFALTVDDLEWMRFTSAFYYGFDPEPLVNGVDPGYTLVIAAVPLVLAAVAAAVFARRDVLV
ncbi:ABC transporter permease [Nocardiopsis halophila]|uniref:ABC transporter permease n=1 Tax=Nocardiopsis halophila TaxID=141692 RepID=UPI00034C788E|nr:ABC transporter permease subunit [Nocardiopsis halophila]